VGAGGLCYLGESRSSPQRAHTALALTDGDRGFTCVALRVRGRLEDGHHSSLPRWLLPARPIQPPTGRVKPLEEDILCLRNMSNWGKQDSAILPQQGLWSLTRSRAESNIMARRKNEGGRTQGSECQVAAVACLCHLSWRL